MRIVGIAQTDEFVDANLLKEFHHTLRGKSVRYRHLDPNSVPTALLGQVSKTWEESGVMMYEAEIYGLTEMQKKVQRLISENKMAASVGLVKVFEGEKVLRLDFHEISMTPKPRNKDARIIHSERFEDKGGDLMSESTPPKVDSKVFEELIDAKNERIAVLEAAVQHMGEKYKTAQAEVHEAVQRAVDAENVIKSLKRAPIITEIVTFECGVNDTPEAQARRSELEKFSDDQLAAVTSTIRIFESRAKNRRNAAPATVRPELRGRTPTSVSAQAATRGSIPASSVPPTMAPVPGLVMPGTQSPFGIPASSNDFSAGTMRGAPPPPPGIGSEGVMFGANPANIKDEYWRAVKAQYGYPVD